MTNENSESKKQNDWLSDVIFIVGMIAVGWGVYDLFGLGWCSIAVGTILLLISIYGALNRDP